jgi:hypothetical protein
LLDGLEIFDEDEEIATDDFLANRAAPSHFPKALAPDGHLPTAMGRDNGAAVDVRGNLDNGEVSATPLRNMREICRWWAQGRGGRTIAVPCHTVARAAVAHKVLLSRTHRLAWDAQQRLCRHQWHHEK